ncbi:MAG: hypothetical protein Q4C55_10050, partial [Eubacterium sp.]|nr:hypothetical protein [Eubacterium sp.]
MTRYCPHCYVGIDPEDAVCKNCGEALNPEPTPPRSSEAEDASFEAVPGDTAVGELTPESKEGPSPEAPDENAAGEGEGTYRPANAFERDTPPEAPRTAASDRSPSDPDKDTSVISLGEWMWSLLLTFIPLVNIIQETVHAIRARS